MSSILYKAKVYPEILLKRITVNAYTRIGNKQVGTMLIVENDDCWEITMNKLFQSQLLGKGIGYLMLQTAIEKLREIGVKKIRVRPKVERDYENKISEEKLISLYERQGFVKDKITDASGKNYYVMTIN